MNRFFAAYFGNLAAMLTVALILIAIGSVVTAEEYFNDRLCAPLPALAQGAALLASEGKNVEVEYADNGDLRVMVDQTLTVWRRMEGTTLFCMQEHLGGPGA